MNSLRSRAVTAGLLIALILVGAKLVDNDSFNPGWLGEATVICTWALALVMGGQVVAIIALMIRAAFLRRAQRSQRSRVKHRSSDAAGYGRRPSGA